MNDIQHSLPPTSVSWRFLRAYLTTFVVILSYSWLSLRARIWGPDFWDDRIIKLHKRNAKRIEETILRLQGIFIKVGQLFSIMTNFLPAEFRSGLRNMQDAVPARPYRQIERRIREELGGNPEEIFATFEESPVASASLGQVHVATTHDGRKVAVKVQHIGVEAMSKGDLKTIKRIVGIVKIFVHVRGLENFYREIRQMIELELDFQTEASHIEKISKNFVGNDKVVLPRVLPELSTSRVLTLEYLEGMKILDKDALVAAGLDPAEVAKDVVTAYCQMIFIDGIYHADPHPGNIIVQPSGKIVFLDFGAVGYLSESMRAGMSSFFEAILKADEAQLLRALRTMGFLQVSGHSSEAATRVIEYFHRRFQEEIRLDSFSLSSVKIDTRKGLETLADLKQFNVGIRELSEAFHIPKEWVLLERTALLLAGLCTHLDPEMNPAATIRPYLEEFVLGKDRDWSEMLFDVSREKIVSLLNLPNLVEKVLDRSLAGKVTFKVEGINEGVERLYAASHQLIYALFSCVSTGIAIYFHSNEDMQSFQYAIYAALGSVGLFLLSVLSARRFRHRR